MEILMCWFIFTEVLDGKDINEVTRQFLINWKASKEARKKKANKLMMTRSLIPFPLRGKSTGSKSTESSLPTLLQLFPSCNYWDQVYFN